VATNYYRSRLSGERLRRCYELAPRRIQQYLHAETQYVHERLLGATSVLELGCGYGRVLDYLIQPGRRLVGIDVSLESLLLAKEQLITKDRCGLVAMDATALGFAAHTFDAVVCLQNGICAFRVNPARLLEEALRVTSAGGCVLFSTYSDALWPERLEWFEAQAAEGLVGEIDYAATQPGEIVCKDGFRSGTLSVSEFTKQPVRSAADGRRSGLIESVLRGYVAGRCLTPLHSSPAGAIAGRGERRPWAAGGKVHWNPTPTLPSVAYWKQANRYSGSERRLAVWFFVRVMRS
jgi:SAM-dependent methyltransferase